MYRKKTVPEYNDPDKVAVCKVCVRPTYADERPYICADCYDIVQRMANGDHTGKNTNLAYQNDAERQHRIAVYTERASCGVPLFCPPVSPPITVRQ